MAGMQVGEWSCRSTRHVLCDDGGRDGRLFAGDSKTIGEFAPKLGSKGKLIRVAPGTAAARDGIAD